MPVWSLESQAWHPDGRPWGWVPYCGPLTILAGIATALEASPDSSAGSHPVLSCDVPPRSVRRSNLLQRQPAIHPRQRTSVRSWTSSPAWVNQFYADDVLTIVQLQNASLQMPSGPISRKHSWLAAGHGPSEWELRQSRTLAGRRILEHRSANDHQKGDRQGKGVAISLGREVSYGPRTKHTVLVVSRRVIQSRRIGL